MDYQLIGISHKSAPVEVRERFAVPESSLHGILHELARHPGVNEALVLSTCNRVELLVHSKEASADLLEFIRDYCQPQSAEWQSYLYSYQGADAVRHLFRVASGLDSMILGEAQILGQLKQAYATARVAGTARTQLAKLMNRTFAVAKRVRRETAVGCSAVSIASVAVELARNIFGQLTRKQILLVGSGKMAELVCRHLLSHGANSITVSNRTLENATVLASQFGGDAIPLDQIQDACVDADIVITSTGSPKTIFRLEHGQMLVNRRKGRPIFFIDIAVPRDVDPELAKLDGVFVYNIDDLRETAMPHVAQREQEAVRAERIIEEEVEKMKIREQAFNVVPTIVSLQHYFESIRQNEFTRLRGRLGLLTPEQSLAVDLLTRSIVNKITHAPISNLKVLSSSNEAPAAVEIVNRLFNLRNQNAA